MPDPNAPYLGTSREKSMQALNSAQRLDVS